MVFNTSKAYVKQLDKWKPFHLLQPVYSLNFVQGDLHKGLSEWYHPYQLVHIYHSDRVFDGLKIVFAEMKKYENLTVKGNSKKDLWMRFFTEMTEKTRKPAPELLADPEVAKAIELLEIINYNDAEQELYDRYWDAVSVEATWISIGQREGEKIGMRQGEANTKRLLVLNMLANGLEPSMVAKIAELTEEEVRKIAQKL